MPGTSFAMLAETTLKQRYRAQAAGRVKRGMIGSFGLGTELTPRKTPISLTGVLPSGKDVTHWFG